MSDDRQFETTRYDTQRVREADRSASGRRYSGSGGGQRISPSQREALRRKGRVRRFFLRTFLWFVLVIASSLALSGAGWLLANDFAALNKEPLTATVKITKDDDLDSIAEMLKQEGLIEYKWFFKIFGKVAHAENKIGIGTYELNTEMDYNALINGMRSSSGSLNSTTVRVTIQEGYNVRKIIEVLAQYGVSSEEELTEAAKNHNFSYSFLDSSKKGDITRLEGYLFPDTYEFYVGGDAATALNKMLSNFNSKMNKELREKVESSGYTLDQILTIASLIEKETTGNDREEIASVIYNRLNHSGETNYMLQIDASVIYGLGDSFTPPLTKAMLEIDTPYNTYMHQGLPPTPIANPGLAAIQAALNPTETNYYYYALGKDGQHHFSRTLDEHNAFLESLK